MKKRWIDCCWPPHNCCAIALLLRQFALLFASFITPQSNSRSSWRSRPHSLLVGFVWFGLSSSFAEHWRCSAHNRASKDNHKPKTNSGLAHPPFLHWKSRFSYCGKGSKAATTIFLHSSHSQREEWKERLVCWLQLLDWFHSISSNNFQLLKKNEFINQIYCYNTI